MFPSKGKAVKKNRPFLPLSGTVSRFPLALTGGRALVSRAPKGAAEGKASVRVVRKNDNAFYPECQHLISPTKPSKGVSLLRLCIATDGQKLKFAGNLAKVFQQLLNSVSEGQEVRVLTIFYDSKKEKRRFKRELRDNGRDLLKVAKNYLEWWDEIQKRRQKRLTKISKKVQHGHSP